MKKKPTTMAICILLALTLTWPGILAAAQPQAVLWDEVSADGLPAEVALWVDQHYREHGLYVLPAGAVRYVLIAWGEKPTGGYQMEVISAQSSAHGTLDLTIELTAPGPDEPVIQVITYPYVLLALEAGTESIVANFVGASWLGESLGKPVAGDPPVVMQARLLPGSLAPHPLVVWGRAQVYEATFQLVVEDGHYHLVHELITVAEGGPAWAEFAIALFFDAFTSPAGAVIALVEDAEDGTLQEVSTLPITFGPASLPFGDVTGHWAEAAIRRAIFAGVIHGYPDGTFRPEQLVSRAEFFKMLVATQLGGQYPPSSTTELPFADVQEHWVADYLRWALDAGWLPEGGYYGLHMGPDQVISRQEMAFLIAHLTGASATADELNFSDTASIEEMLIPYVAGAVKHGLLLGYPDGTFRPTAGLKRSEAVTVAWRTARRLLQAPPPQTGLTFTFNFADGKQGWTGDFTDLPADYEEDIYDLQFGWAALPEELERDESALRIGGINRSDDLFMYVKRLLTAADGIEAQTTYRISFVVEFATNAPAGAVGVGGPPGEAVWVKVGASAEEPIPVIIDWAGVPYYTLNVDKGWQNEDGENALRIGDVAKVECAEFDRYELKTLDNLTLPLEITSDAQGNLWVFVGTDSGFEGLTVLYYNRIHLHLEKVE